MTDRKPNAGGFIKEAKAADGSIRYRVYYCNQYVGVRPTCELAEKLIEEEQRADVRRPKAVRHD